MSDTLEDTLNEESFETGAPTSSDDCVFVDYGELVEVSQVSIIHQIFSAVPAEDSRTVTEVARKTGCDIAVASKVLSKLAELGCVKQESVGRETRNTRVVETIVLNPVIM